MDKRIKVRNTFAAENVHREFYTGGQIEISKDGTTLFCQCNNHLTIVDIATVRIQQYIPCEYNELDGQADNDDDIVGDPILTFALSDDNELLASGHKSGLIKLWSWKNAKLVGTWKCMHKGPLMKLAFDAGHTYLASGSTDSVIRIWSLVDYSCVHKFGGVHGVTSFLEFHIVASERILFSSGDDNIIRGWRLRDGDRNENQLEYQFAGHFNRVTKILIARNSSFLISVSREPTVIIWDLKSKKQLRSIPTYESIETATLLPDCVVLPGHEEPCTGTLVALGGDKGKIRIFNIDLVEQIYEHDVTSSKENRIMFLEYNEPRRNIMSVLADQTIVLYKLDDNFSYEKQMTGFPDEILDVRFFGEADEFIIVASNSSELQTYDRDMNCNLLKGHSDFVVSLSTSAAFPNLVVSGSKDNSVRVWMMKDGVFKCVAVGRRHTASVGAVALPNRKKKLGDSTKRCGDSESDVRDDDDLKTFDRESTSDDFFVSASEDTTLKLWMLPKLKYNQCQTLQVWKTTIAHDQPINSVCLSPRDDLIVTGSSDKTAKLWSTSDLSLLAVFRGHRRAIWCVKFSPVDQVLLTASADMTMKLWNLGDYTLLKTMETEDSSVLNCVFFNRGTQIISCGNDGLLRVWTIKDNQCVASLDKHSAKVWTIAVSKDESRFVSGGADSRLIIWRDTTQETHLKEIETNREKIEQEQHLANLLKSDELLSALQYAITLNRPFQVLRIIQNIALKEDALEKTINRLNMDQKQTLVDYAAEWNTNGKHCYVAQMILSLLIDEITSKKLRIEEKTLNGLIAYTNRHYSRLASIFEDFYIVPYTVKLMEPHSV